MIIFEPQCIGIEHAKINASYILIYSRAFPDDLITFYGESEHIALVTKELLSYSINIRYIKILIKNTKGAYLAWVLREFRNVFNVMLDAKSSKSDVLFLSVTSVTLIAIKLIGFNLNTRIYVIVHGILESIVKVPDGVLRKVYWFRNYFVYFNISNIKYILLGEYIKTNTLNILPKLKKYVYSLELPYNLAKPKESVGLEPLGKLVFASAGVATILKGSHQFFNLAQDIRQKYKLTNVEFFYIGYFIDKRMNQYLNNNVLLPSKDAAIDELNYQNYFLRANFIILFYPQDSYKLTFSGIFLDAVKFEKPIIAIRNDFFTYYFNKYGDLGWLCDDYNEALDLVVKLSNYVDPEDLKKFNRNFHKVKSDLSIDNLSIRLRNILG